MQEVIEKILFVILGWALGLLSPVIIDYIKRKREIINTQKAISIELQELRFRLVLASHNIYSHFGMLSKENLSWMKSHLEQHSGLKRPTTVISIIDQQINLPADQLAELNRQQKAPPLQSLQIPKYPIPILDSRISAIWSHDVDMQRRLLEIRTSIDMLNEHVDRSRKLNDMTFSKHEGDNHSRILENIDQCYHEYAKRAKIIIEQIEQFHIELSYKQ